MPQSATPVIPFYESEGPPQALPLLTYHTEMFCPALSFVLISSQEEMAFSTLLLRRHTLTPSRVFMTTSRGTTPIPPRAPTPKVVKLVSFTAEHFTPNSEASTYSSLSSIDSKDSKIPKPDGEAGRPGRGGYNLEMALNWDDEHFKNLKKHCDVSKSKKHQTPAALQEVHSEALGRFPELADYQGCWPVGDIIQMQLKNTSAKARNNVSNYLRPQISMDTNPSIHFGLHNQAIIHTYPPQPVIPSNEDSPMELANPWQSVRRMRDDDEQRPNKVFLKEVDQSSKLREDVRELHFSNHDLLLRKRHAQISSNVRELDMQSVIVQYQEHNQSLQRDNADALASLDQNHRQEVVDLQNNVAKAQNEARTEIGQKEARFEHEMHLAKDRLLADKEAELICLNASYSSKIDLLNSQIRHANTQSPTSAPAWRHLVGKKPVATCTNIIGSESDADEEPQMTSNGRPLTSLLGDVPIAHATVGMLAEALAKVLQIPQTTSPRGPRSGRKPVKPPVENFTNNQRRDNKKRQANIRELFKTTFHATKDEEYMLHVPASREAILSFADEMGPGPDPLALQWDMATTHKSEWNQKVIDFLCSQYATLQESNGWAGRSTESIRDDIELKFGQCRKCWRKAQPLSLGDGTRKTMQQVGDRLVDQTNERLRLARVLTHRTMKFETRKKVTLTYLQSMMENLGKDGMSSDESEYGDGDVQVFRRKSMPWRADFSHEMQIIDQQRLTGAVIFTPRRSKPAKHFRNANRDSSRTAIQGLPTAFYDPTWLTEQCSSFMVSKKKFQSMEIIVAR
ncbi:hypothetical protein EV702DRAFT_1050411 [Suillus placidus]|uniref:Uncharacterized protein n=1 Tax=Suillus placidus TaxID=48579 RepID=A0A9P6ZIC4_9AGAM|nr:hypothetical protein EV702DRAFT_1050411 [Suillus placidus]